MFNFLNNTFKVCTEKIHIKYDRRKDVSHKIAAAADTGLNQFRFRFHSSVFNAQILCSRKVSGVKLKKADLATWRRLALLETRITCRIFVFLVQLKLNGRCGSPR